MLAIRHRQHCQRLSLVINKTQQTALSRWFEPISTCWVTQVYYFLIIAFEMSDLARKDEVRGVDSKSREQHSVAGCYF
jgi:hypothetical protein